MKKNLITLLCLFITLTSVAQENLLQSGPMVGYSDFREALIWVQTTEAAEVKIGYFAAGETEKFTKTVATTEAGDFIAKLTPNEVDYGKTYTYKLYINDTYVPRDYKLAFQTQTLWQFRTNPPDFKIAIGSCSFINETKDDRPKPYGGKYQIFNSILEKNPDLMLWVGDNMYLRTPDFMTETGIRHRYRHTRATKELQALLGSVHHYATWDDHDFGPNDADRSYVNKKLTEQTFNDYWGNLNTNAAGNGGVTQHFAWNDVEFFMLDDRYHRAPNRDPNKDKAYLGKQQLDWLIDALTNSRATFKVIINGGQVISDVAKFENYATYPTERAELLQRLHDSKIEGVLFISGDRHHTEISRLERTDAYPLIDITCSPLTAGTHSARDEGNTLQVKGKTFYNRNFGIMEVTGKRRERILVLTIYDSDGQKAFDYEIKAQDLRYPRK
ncbi:alkaline phosphatase D family protein [Kordia algicida OT-1]|uniref:Alkaline phosphatase n=1 Tax=Kordia algicida OT-1 TaxID=391587 RepID=A9EDN9_9FLAO|nr:alkaline phosphatase D family protein [Kordia algicida]EDP94203.1 alkaline phosphatase [Kordia algicida OT-1]